MALHRMIFHLWVLIPWSWSPLHYIELAHPPFLTTDLDEPLRFFLPTCIHSRLFYWKTPANSHRKVSGSRVKIVFVWTGRGSNFFLQQAMKLLTAILNPQSISRIHHPDQGISLFEVIAPIWPKCLLTTDIPCKCQQKPNIGFDGSHRCWACSFEKVSMISE